MSTNTFPFKTTTSSSSSTTRKTTNPTNITIEWAAENGDETYLEYTDGKPLYQPCIRYERKVEGTEAGSPDDETVSFSPTAGEVPKGIAQIQMKEDKR